MNFKKVMFLTLMILILKMFLHISSIFDVRKEKLHHKAFGVSKDVLNFGSILKMPHVHKIECSNIKKHICDWFICVNIELTKIHKLFSIV